MASIIERFNKYRTHRTVDPDAALAAWLAVHYGEELFPGISQHIETNAQQWLEFGDEADTPNYVDCRAQGIICGDFGGDPLFDDHVHHKSIGSSSMMMATACGLGGSHCLWPLIEAINAHDQGREHGRFGIFGGRIQTLRPYFSSEDYRVYSWLANVFAAELHWQSANPIDRQGRITHKSIDSLVARWLCQSKIEPVAQARIGITEEQMRGVFTQHSLGERSRAMAELFGLADWEPLQSILGYVERSCREDAVDTYTLAGFLPRMTHYLGEDMMMHWFNQVITAEVKLQQNFFGSAQETFREQVVGKSQYQFIHCPQIGRRIAIVWLATNNDLAISYARSPHAWRDTNAMLGMPFMPAVVIQRSHIDPNDPERGYHIRVAVNQRSYRQLDLTPVAQVLRVMEMEKRRGEMLPAYDWLSRKELAQPGKTSLMSQWYVCTTVEAPEEQDIDMNDNGEIPEADTQQKISPSLTWAILNGGRKAQNVEPTALVTEDVIRACILGLSGQLPTHEQCPGQDENICMSCVWARFHLPQCNELRIDPPIAAKARGFNALAKILGF